MGITITSNDNYDLDGATGSDGDNGTWWSGGKGTLFVEATTADSGVVTLQASKTRTQWGSVGSDTAITTTDTTCHMGNFELAPCYLRINVASGGGSHSSLAHVSKIDC